MNPPNPDCGALAPLTYHTVVLDYLRLHEPEVWRWASERMTDAQQRESLRAALLRDTYRIEPGAHHEIHALLATAMARLGIDAPATLYQSPGQEMNAALLYVPGEIHIVVQGPLFERMAPDELLAVFGHELAHHLLWSRDDGALLVADRILHDAVATAQATSSQRETWRRYALYTELFADRGAAVAAGAVAPAVAALVKVQTGIGAVDAAAYLRQAAEIDSGDAGAGGQTSAAHTHPETFIRARALALWWEGEPGLDAWLDKRLQGPLALARLDLPGQVRLQALTRAFLAHYLAPAGLANDAVLAQLRMLFPDWGNEEAEAQAAFEPDCLRGEAAGECVRDYLNALMLDLALVDPGQQDAALLRAGHVAQALGSLDALMLNLRRDAGFGKREIDRYKRRLAKETAA